MGSLPESELPFYFKIKLVDEIKLLALDFQTQRKLIPKVIMWALPYELLDDWDHFYVLRKNTVFNYGYFVEYKDDFSELDQLINEIKQNKSYSIEDVENGQDWERLRQFCRLLLKKMGEENDIPESWMPGWRFFSRDNYGIFEEEKMTGARSHQRQPKPLIIIVTSLVVIVGLIGIIWAAVFGTAAIQADTEPDAFQAMFPEGTIFNRGLRIAGDVETVDLSGEMVPFTVANRSREMIRIDSGFITVYIWRYDPESNQWEDISIPVVYALVSNSYLLGTGLSVVENAYLKHPVTDIDTSGFGEPDKLPTDLQDTVDSLRFVVIGIGETTGKMYVAYVDLPVE